MKIQARDVVNNLGEPVGTVGQRPGGPVYRVEGSDRIEEALQDPIYLRTLDETEFGHMDGSEEIPLTHPEALRALDDTFIPRGLYPGPIYETDAPDLDYKGIFYPFEKARKAPESLRAEAEAAARREATRGTGGRLHGQIAAKHEQTATRVRERVWTFPRGKLDPHVARIAGVSSSGAPKKKFLNPFLAGGTSRYVVSEQGLYHVVDPDGKQKWVTLVATPEAPDGQEIEISEDRAKSLAKLIGDAVDRGESVEDAFLSAVSAEAAPPVKAPKPKPPEPPAPKTPEPKPPVSGGAIQPPTLTNCPVCGAALPPGGDCWEHWEECAAEQDRLLEEAREQAAEQERRRLLEEAREQERLLEEAREAARRKIPPKPESKPDVAADEKAQAEWDALSADEKRARAFNRQAASGLFYANPGATGGSNMFWDPPTSLRGKKIPVEEHFDSVPLPTDGVDCGFDPDRHTDNSGRYVTQDALQRLSAQSHKALQDAWLESGERIIRGTHRGVSYEIMCAGRGMAKHGDEVHGHVKTFIDKTGEGVRGIMQARGGVRVVVATHSTMNTALKKNGIMGVTRADGFFIPHAGYSCITARALRGAPEWRQTVVHHEIGHQVDYDLFPTVSDRPGFSDNREWRTFARGRYAVKKLNAMGTNVYIQYQQQFEYLSAYSTKNPGEAFAEAVGKANPNMSMDHPEILAIHERWRKHLIDIPQQDGTYKERAAKVKEEMLVRMRAWSDEVYAARDRLKLGHIPLEPGAKPKYV